MLSVPDDYVHEHFPQASLTLMGQDLNAESIAIAKADLVITGQTVENMVWGDTLTGDGRRLTRRVHFRFVHREGLAERAVKGVAVASFPARLLNK